jgi:hypothetical protein
MRDGSDFKIVFPDAFGTIDCECLNCDSPQDPAAESLRESTPFPEPTTFPQIDWVRLGLVCGPELDTRRWDQTTSVKIGAKLSLATFSWKSFYVIPVDFVATYSFNGLIDIILTPEVGFLHRWGAHQIRIGAGVGFAYYGWAEERVNRYFGVAFRPAIRYRRYWDKFGLEIGVELPLRIQAKENGGHIGGVSGYSPLFSISGGM